MEVVTANISSSAINTVLLKYCTHHCTFSQQPFKTEMEADIAKSHGPLHLKQNMTKLEERWNHIRSQVIPYLYKH